MKPACKLVRQHLIDQPVLLHPALADKSLTANADMKMGFAFRAATSMTGMTGGFIPDFEKIRVESVAEKVFKAGGTGHAHSHAQKFFSDKLVSLTVFG